MKELIRLIKVAFWWLTGQYSIRVSLQEVLAKQDRQMGTANIEAEFERLRRIEKYEYNSKLSTKVQHWVAMEINNNTDWDLIADEVSAVESAMNRLKHELMGLEKDIKIPDQPKETVVQDSTIMDFTVKRGKGGLSKTSR